MATKTTNYNLHKFDLQDAPPDITVINESMDIIDAKLKEISDGKAEHTAYVANADLNALLEDKAYICAGTMKNTPTPNTYCFVRVYDTESTNRVLQVCYVPQSDNTIRTFVRAITGTAFFGAWRELGTTAYIDEQMALLKILVDENTFRNKATTNAIAKGLTTVVVHDFADLSELNSAKGTATETIASYYKSDQHIFDKTGDEEIYIFTQTQVVTSGNNNVWVLVDWENVDGGSVEIAVTRTNVTYTNVPNNTLVSISGQNAGATMDLRIKLTGKLKLKNVAWGCKA